MLSGAVTAALSASPYGRPAARPSASPSRSKPMLEYAAPAPGGEKRFGLASQVQRAAAARAASWPGLIGASRGRPDVWVARPTRVIGAVGRLVFGMRQPLGA